LKKEYQASDWRRRPLTEPMMKYGLYDAHYLLELRKLMIRDLTRGQLWDDTSMEDEEEARMVARALSETMRLAQKYGEEDEIDWEQATQNSANSEDDGYFTPTEDISFDEDDIGGSGPKENGISSTHRQRQKSVFLAKELRMHVSLMKVISISQERCLSFWGGKKESPSKNEVHISLLRRTSSKDDAWRMSYISLYDKLVKWRDKVAKKEGIMPSQVCPLDLLVNVAYKKPVCMLRLRQIQYFLPIFLESTESREHVDEMLAIVRLSLGEDGTTPKVSTYSYAARSARKRCKSTNGIISNVSKMVESGNNPSNLSEKNEHDNMNGNHSGENVASSNQSRSLTEEEEWKKRKKKERAVWERSNNIKKLAIVVATIGVVVVIGILRKKKR